MIKKIGSRYCLYTKDGSRKLGCHATRAEAVAQEQAVEAGKKKDRYAELRAALGEGVMASIDNLQSRYLLVSSGPVKVTERTLWGRKYLVVPVVALVEGVVHASNAEMAELVQAQDFGYAPGGWNGRPVFYGHPTVDDVHVSGNDPDILEELSVGIVFNAMLSRDNRLTMDAWIDEERANEIAPELVERVRASDDIEISVGVYVDSEKVDGEFNGKRYAGRWTRIVPDHLGILRKDDVGACSRKMGCGVRTAKEGQMNEKTPSIFGRMMATVRGLITGNDELLRDLILDSDIPQDLTKAVRAKDPQAYYVEDWDLEQGICYYCKSEDPQKPGSTYTVMRKFMRDGDHFVVGDEETKVETRQTYVPVEGDEYRAAEGKPPCGCHKGEATMSEKIKALIAKFSTLNVALFNEKATDEHVGALETLLNRAPVEVIKEVVKEVKVEVIKEVPVGAPRTLAEAVAMVPEAEQAPFKAYQATQVEKKNATIKVLKDSGRCDLTDEVLQAKSQTELDQLVKLSGSKPVDFSAAGTSRTAAEQQPNTVPAAPDLAASIRAAQAKK